MMSTDPDLPAAAPLTFHDLDLPEEILLGIREAGFTHCTPIQALTLPVALQGRDVAGKAQTGTGKTAAFLIAAFTRLLRHAPLPGRRPTDVRMLVLAPTRELAIQIHRDAMLLGQHTGLRMVLAYGGTGYEQQREDLARGADILVGTPGRIIDFLKQKVFGLQRVEVLILDEADRMFDLGFIKDIRYLLHRCSAPEQRQSMLFSATLSLRVMELAYEHMNLPEKVVAESDTTTSDSIRQQVFYPANDEKRSLLLGLIRALQPERAIVFVNTRHVAERLCDWLQANDAPAALLSGDVPQSKRSRLLGQFAHGEFRFLVATDVAARGLHIPEVTHVFNYDLPQSAEDYVHRIGRTGRAGACGDAISFACEEYAFHLPEIEAFLGQRIPMGTLPPIPDPETLQRPPRVARVRVRPAPAAPNTDTRGVEGAAAAPGRRRPRRKKTALSSPHNTGPETGKLP